MNNIILGRYLEGNSVIHRMDARAKLILSFYFILIVFLCNNWQTYTLLAVFTFFCVLCSRIDVKYFIKGVRPLIGLILITVLLQLFFTSGGHVYWHWGIFQLTSFGIINAVYIFCRILLIVFMSTLLTATTTPLEIADGLEALMRPLRKLKVPVDEIALMISIALRFVPTLMDETQKIINAQRSRGVNFGEGNIIKQAKMLIPILIPLFVNSIKRAEDLAVAMEARGYQGGLNRTRYRLQKWHTVDTVAIIIFGGLTLLLLGLRG
ncbi:MAG TPA: energy-coupling factor transporter transmembrane protein EcfT [Candidatus Ligilactobacillus excrementigallinarum]|uniref:Energy-coupling factor transporter transmembrane protein EcfT n=1 Tax=Candidatus Ligilactobacillus excrementigallinarum TaxID=2838641 RepID=A0A9D1UX13_9LACO|nr:energy-coupling factor transporter transmembrane protein EcfT [Candidatus Ligilactobacillus excrementigallinarum]